MILVGELVPGQQVTQDELAHQLGVSTMPVREALLRLSHEGFMEGRRGRPHLVVRTSREDIEDIYWVHALLAGELTARASERADEEARRRLLEIVDGWGAAMERGDPEELEALNFQFHRIINLSARSPKLVLLLSHTLRFIPERFYSLVPDWPEVSEIGHRRITDALVRRDPDAAREAAEEHVRSAGELLVAYFDESGFWTHPAQDAEQ